MAKKRKPVDRRMISVPPELNARMAKHADVNWSAIACRAFDAQLGAIAAQKKEKNMEDVIARLKASKHESETKLVAEGIKAGREWASHKASVPELRRLERLDERMCNEANFPGWDEYFVSDVRSAFSAADRLAFELLGSDDLDRRDSTEFWEKAIGMDQYESNLSEAEFLYGFAEGALQIWNDVKDQV